MRSEARFAVGSRQGPRSTIWKAWVQGDEAYILSRMFGSDMKVSFHSSGKCQWSATDSWVRRSQVRNAERHVHRWQVDYPMANEALLVFHVGIPASELRPLPAPTDKKKVWWVSGIPVESTARFLFYMTRPSESEPASATSSQMRHLFSLRLRSQRWLVIFVDVISLSPADLAASRAAVLEQVKSVGLVPEAHHRLSLFSQPSKAAGWHGLLELCLTEVHDFDTTRSRAQPRAVQLL